MSGKRKRAYVTHKMMTSVVHKYITIIINNSSSSNSNDDNTMMTPHVEIQEAKLTKTNEPNTPAQ